MDSIIKMKEEVENKERTFGSLKTYFPAKIKLLDGTEKEALFTIDQLNVSMERAARNPEDMPQESFWEFLFG